MLVTVFTGELRVAIPAGYRGEGNHQDMATTISWVQITAVGNEKNSWTCAE